MHDPAAAADIGFSRHRQRAGDLAQQPDPEVLLQKRDASIHSGLEHVPLFLRGIALRRVGIEPDSIAGLAAEHLPARYAPGFAGEIHHRHLDAAYASGLACWGAELFDLAKDLVDVAGVLAENAALEEQCVGLARAIADLAPPDQALIRIHADNRARHRRTDDHREPQIRDLQCRRLGRALHVGLYEVRRGIGGRVPRQRHRAGRAQTEGLEERAPMDPAGDVVQQRLDCSLHGPSLLVTNSRGACHRDGPMSRERLMAYGSSPWWRGAGPARSTLGLSR